MAEAIPINQPFAGSLAAPLGAADTSLTLSSGQGARFSDPSGDIVRLLIVRASDGALEYLTFDTRVGDVLLNLARGAEAPGDSALEFAIGDMVIELLTQGGLTALLAAAGGGGSGTSISQAGGSVAVDGSGNVTTRSANGGAGQSGADILIYAGSAGAGGDHDGGIILAAAEGARVLFKAAPDGSISMGDAANLGSGFVKLPGDGSIVLNVVAGLIATGLPTSDPVVAGALWNNAGVLNVSAG